MTAKPRLGLGLDAGGTRTRWAIAAGGGEIVAEGHVRGMSALQVADARREQVARTLGELARHVLAIAKPDRGHAGLVLHEPTGRVVGFTPRPTGA